MKLRRNLLESDKIASNLFQYTAMLVLQISVINVPGYKAKIHIVSGLPKVSEPFYHGSDETVNTFVAQTWLLRGDSFPGTERGDDLIVPGLSRPRGSRR